MLLVDTALKDKRLYPPYCLNYYKLIVLLRKEQKMFKHIAVVCLMLCVTSGLLFAGEQTGKPSKEAFVQKAQKIQMPFIANEGQADERVKYYANTFGGSVCVAKEGGFVYIIPKPGMDHLGTVE